MKNQLENRGEVIIYKTESGREAIDVRLENGTVWLNQAQMAALFDRDRVAITQHIGNIFKEKELQKKSVCKDFLHTAASDFFFFFFYCVYFTWLSCILFRHRSGQGPTGTVSFYNGTVDLAHLLGNATISGTTATLKTAFSSVGTPNVIAVYNGDATYASQQNQTTVNVAPNATASIVSSANNVALNATPSYTVTLTGNSTLGAPGSAAGGTVTFTLISETLVDAVSGTTGGNNGHMVATSNAIPLSDNGNNTSSATWAGAAPTAPGSHFVLVTYTPPATGAGSG